MSIGIYKIESPSGKIYIGQSINIEKRWNDYSKYEYICVNQRRLKNTFKKYGVENHIFEVIEECSIEQLNKRERYWQDYYNVIGVSGLNSLLTNTNELPRIMSQDIKDRIGRANKGKPSCNKDKKLSQSHKDKIGKANKGVPKSKGFIDNLSNILKKPVLQFNKEGELINEFNSYLEAKRITGIDCQFALNKTAKTSKGFIWIYKNNWDGNKPILTSNGNLGKIKKNKL